ncbi:MAG: radical SAM protein [Lachnospiraceae bacterium]|nr:radical SAM protein [Lachnospiraceae bacterium]
MNLTLVLTQNCNMDCTYCIHEKKPIDMSEEVMEKACQLIFSSGRSAGFSFFGGEPLLKADLIYKALAKCREISNAKNIPFECKITTNATLIDEQFISQAKEYKMGVALSFDGLIQNKCRKMADGSESFDLVEEKVKMLLKEIPSAYAMMTVAPEAAAGLADSVKYLYEIGFRRINTTIAYGNRVCWDEDSLEVVEAEMDKVARFYEECFEKDYFFFGPFNGKIKDYVTGKSASEKCHLGMRQMIVATDGKIYVCNQFIGDEEYCAGDVFKGLDRDSQIRIANKALTRKEPEDCLECDIRDRCTHTCGCNNRMETGDEDIVSATTCLYEQMLVKKSDELAERLYNRNPKLFEKKFG